MTVHHHLGIFKGRLCEKDAGFWCAKSGKPSNPPLSFVRKLSRFHQNLMLNHYISRKSDRTRNMSVVHEGKPHRLKGFILD